MTAACARQISEIHIILIKDGGSLQTFGVGGEGGAVLNPSVDHRLNQCRLQCAHLSTLYNLLLLRNN